MMQLSTDTFMMLYFRPLPENALGRMEADVIGLAQTYPLAIELIAPVREFGLYLQEQGERELRTLADDLGIAPFIHSRSASTTSVGVPATQENIFLVQNIAFMVEAGFLYLLRRPMRYLEYVANIVFNGNDKGIKEFFSLPSLIDVQKHKPIDILSYQSDPNEAEQKCLAKVLEAVRKRDADAVWAMRYIAKFLSTNENRRPRTWIDGLYTVATFAHIINSEKPKLTWDQLFTNLSVDWFTFFEQLGSSSEEQQVAMLERCLIKNMN